MVSWKVFNPFFPCIRIFFPRFLAKFLFLHLLLVAALPIVCVFPQLLGNDLVFQTTLFQLWFMMELFTYGQGVNVQYYGSCWKR